MQSLEYNLNIPVINAASCQLPAQLSHVDLCYQVTKPVLKQFAVGIIHSEDPNKEGDRVLLTAVDSPYDTAG